MVTHYLGGVGEKRITEDTEEKREITEIAREGRHAPEERRQKRMADLRG
jgi:hypothetical protein